jgi:hypothetical protein
LISVRFGFLGKKPVKAGLARFFPVLAWFFSVWLGFSGLACFGSVFFGLVFSVIFFPVFSI